MALRSMTGFGVAARPWPGDGVTPSATVHVELRSVNARFRELKIRQPFGPAVEQVLRQQLERRVGRGRVELKIHLQIGTGPGDGAGSDALAALGLDPQRVAASIAASEEVTRLAGEGGLELTVPNSLELLRFMVSSHSGGAPDPRDAPPGFLGELVEEAIGGLCALRDREGEALTAALVALAGDLRGAVERLREALEGEPDRILGRLSRRVQDLCARAGVDGPEPTRLAQEVALLAARADVAEELARIDSHLVQVEGVLEADASPGQGKTLDFLSQELLREVTTIGGKISSHAGSAIVIEAKGTIERIREQVQNVE